MAWVLAGEQDSCYTNCMKNNNNTDTHAKNTQTATVRKFTQIKLGIDVHADSYRVVRQIDHATPQPAQKLTPEKFLEFAAHQLTLAQEVHSCYEAGPFGYALHRKLLELGVRNVVIRPQNWDELGKGVKTDKTDALALVQRLDRYVQGNRKALAVITAPTAQEDQERSFSRRREQLQKDRQAHEAQGRSLLLYHGCRVKGQWWKERTWDKWKQSLPVWLVALLESLRSQILNADQWLQAYSVELEKAAQPQAKGFGRLTSETLRREIFDWNRFKNRRQVASLTGMCPRVRASGNKSFSGSINKQGNPRLRRLLVELAWRVIRYQPGYGPVQRWKEQLSKTHAGARKKAAVAIARKLAIDIWRMETGKTTAHKLHLR
jgi:transposase